MAQPRELWKSRIGLVLATAGNAVGLGNFLRFPVQCAENGGGAFMVPYFICLLLFGIPLMWVEWAMGRHGGRHGHGTTPGMFHRLWNNRISKYLGTFGILISFGVGVYYVYIMSWTLGYTFFSLNGTLMKISSPEEMGLFLSSYQGLKSSVFFDGIGTAYWFYLISLGLTIYVLSKGVVRGLERLAKYGMPILFLFSIVLIVRIFTLGTPDPAIPENSIATGLGFLWNPDFSSLSSPKVWLAAAGQVFFTLSVGFGAIQTYASYIKKNDDIALNGLTTASTNSFVEVILGGSIAIPIAVAFFGIAGTQAVAQGGAFNLGFQAMPMIFQKIPFGQVFGTVWFFLLFVAALTSAVAIVQPFMAFIQDEFQCSRKKATVFTGAALFIFCQPVIFFLGNGFLDEMDFWLGTFGVTVFAVVEIIVFIWLFGPNSAWKEITRGADIKVPRFFYYVLTYLTPVFLFVLLGTWLYQSGWDNILLKKASAENLPYVIGVRAMLVLMLLGLIIGVKHSFAHHRLKSRETSS